MLLPASTWRRFQHVCLGFAGLLLSVGGAHARVPSTIALLKADVHRQIDTTAHVPLESGLQLGVRFSAPPPADTTVTLSVPGRPAVALTRAPDGTFVSLNILPDRAALDAAYPAGTYTIQVGGSSASTTTFSLPAFAPVPPVRITNFDALQAWPDAYAEPSWEPIAGASEPDTLSLMVRSQTGFTTATGPIPPTSTTWSTAALPTQVPLEGLLDYVQATIEFLNGGTTSLAIGNGVKTVFSLRCNGEAPPRYTSHPESQIGFRGKTVVLEARATGTTAEFQLAKDGSALGAAGPPTSSEGGEMMIRYTIPVVDESVAGRYTIWMSYGNTTSIGLEAFVAVTPTYDVSNYAGAWRSAGQADGPALSARFFHPGGIVRDAQGRLIVADTNNHTLRRIARDGFVSTIAGAAGESGSTDGPAGSARFMYPRGLAIDDAGNVYIADSGNHTIRRLSPSGEVTTLAGGPGQLGAVDGDARSARFGEPYALAIDAAGRLAIADYRNFKVRMLSPEGQVTTLVANTASPFASDSSTPLGGPTGVALDPSGNLYIAVGLGLLRRSANGELQVMTRTGEGQVLGVNTGIGDGTHRDLGPPMSVACDASGSLYVGAGTGGLWRVTPSGVVQVIAGGAVVHATQDGIGAEAGFEAIEALSVAPDGDVYLAEAGRIRRGRFLAGSASPHIRISRHPESRSVRVGESVGLSVRAFGPGLSYQWYKNGAPIWGVTESSLSIASFTSADLGSYQVRVANGAGVVPSNAVWLSLEEGESEARLINLSVRANSGRDEKTLIVGFVLAGGGGAGTKPLLVRGIGPGLARYDVPGWIPDPKLTLYRETQSLLDNDNWGERPDLAYLFNVVGAFSLTPDSLDAALTAPLAAGPYSVHVTGRGGETGVALAELYELPPTVPGGLRLVNVSARGHVGTDADILIAGFVIAGSGNRTLLIRGVGPSLGQYIGEGVLQDPVLTVFREQTMVASNDDWGGSATLASAASGAGAFAFNAANSKDAALIITLPPGAYTAQVSGAAGVTGIALVEVYDLR